MDTQSLKEIKIQFYPHHMKKLKATRLQSPSMQALI